MKFGWQSLLLRRIRAFSAGFSRPITESEKFVFVLVEIVVRTDKKK